MRLRTSLRPEQTSPLIFLHLPKTAGTTFNTVLLRHFDASDVLLLRSRSNGSDLAEFIAMTEEQRHRIRLLRGHQVFGLHPYLAPGARYLTVLRDPVERVISHYRYVVATQHPLFIDHIRDGDLSLHGYATSGISGELENGQTRWLAGVDDDRPLTDRHLEIAMENIELHFAWVGLVERFDESLVELGRRMRWVRMDYAVSNVGVQNSGPVSPHTRAAIEERNQLDRELYDAIVRRFDHHSDFYRAARRAAAGTIRVMSRRLPRPRRAGRR